MKILEYENKNFFIEHLVFMLEDPSKIEEWISLDHEMWTKYLEPKRGFISKEVWINGNNPGEIQTIICFESLDLLMQINRDEWLPMDEEFKKRFNSPFHITHRIHKENNMKLYKARHFQKLDEDCLQ